MQKLVLIILTIINFLFFFGNNTNEKNTIFTYIPLLSILAAVYYIFKGLFSSKPQIKIVYIILLGILFFNIPWYITYIFDYDECLNTLISNGFSFNHFMKSNYMLGFSLPMIILGYKLKRNNLSTIKRKTEAVPFKALLYIACILLLYNVSIRGIKIGGLFIAEDVDFWYTFLIRFISIACCAYFYNFRMYVIR